jgi:glutamate-1-semialdehyde 2,1-aminomutase
VSTGAIEYVETLPWNDPALVEERLDREGEDVAAIVTEAVMGNGGLIWPEEGFLDSLQRMAADHDALFVLDEVVTGFRMGLGGAQAYFDLQPDLAVFGKAMANGYPCAAVTGRREVMEFVGGSSERATFAGTFSGNPMATAATRGALEALSAVGESGYVEFQRRGERLTSGLREVLADAGEEVFIPDFAGFTQIHFVEGGADPESWADWRDVEPNVDHARYRSFARGLIDRGVFLPPTPDRLNLTHAHTDSHVDEVLDAAIEAAEHLSR